MTAAIAYVLAALLSLGIIVIGARFFFAPRAAAASYGVPAPEGGSSPAYLTIKGLRDASYGVLGLVLLAVAPTDVLGWFLLVVTLAPLGDTMIVLRHGGTKGTAFGVHFATALMLLVTAALFFAS